MLLELQQSDIPLAQHITLQDVTWQEFEAVLEDLGEHRHSKITYANRLLEIMMPLPEHEYNKEIISDLEPDQCFYIQNEHSIRGKQSINLAIDSPPDLAIEIDITTRATSVFMNHWGKGIMAL